MRLEYATKLENRQDAIKKKTKRVRDENNNLIQHNWKTCKILLCGKYRPDLGFVPLKEKK